MRGVRVAGPLEALALAFTVAACVAGPAPTMTTATRAAGLQAAPVRLDPRDPDRSRVGALTYAGGFRLTAADTSRLHGLSGLEAAARPAGVVTFTAVTDDGDVLRFDGVTRPRGWSVPPHYALRRLRGPDLQEVQGKRNSDAEALAALDEDGDTFAVAYERRHRLEAVGGPFDAGPRPAALAGPSGLAALPGNQGVEALARLPLSGRVVLAVGAEDGRIWFCDLPGGGNCALFHRRSGVRGYSLTGLDNLPGSADLIAVYRAYDPLRGMRTVVARITSGATGGRPGETRVLARLESPLAHGNFEGVAALENGRGGWTLYLVSDDGFPRGSPTLLLAFDYTPSAARPAS